MSITSRIERARRDRRSRRAGRGGRRAAIFPEALQPLEDRRLLSVYTVSSLADDGSPGTLRSILQQVDADSAPDTIDFNLPGSAPYVIQPLSALPAITNSVTIDGTSQMGYSGAPIVEINGSQAGFTDGLQLVASNITVQGLIVNQFSNNGIEIEGGTGDLIQGDYIGTDASGTLPVGNSGDGITVDTTSNDTIGGTTAQTHNIISANGAKGIHFIFGTNTGMLVEGNDIGTDVTGTRRLGNGANGIDIFANASNNTFGGTAAGAGNVIAANNGQGVEIFGGGSPNNSFIGNFIGTNAAGTPGLGNNAWGIDAGSSGTLIEGNVISDNGSGGVQVSASGFVIQGNEIGTDLTGTQDLGNQGPGIQVNSSDTQIGGLGAGQANVIAFNGSGFFGPHAGVAVVNNSTGVSILSNSIFSNAQLGIDLNNDGVTLDHPGGPVPGANFDQNFPVLGPVYTFGGSTFITGTFNSAPSSTYTIQFFDNPTADPSGYGQGKALIGTTTVTTDAGGNASFQVGFPVAVNAGDAISATATDSSGDTSEFAQDVAPVPLTSPIVAVDDSDNTDVNTTLTVAAPGVQANDFSVFGGSFTSVLVSSTSHGSLIFHSNGSFTYVPKSGFTGTDSFTYDDVQNGDTSNVATVTISVNPKTLYVTNTNDSGPGSLRQAMTAAAASNSPGADTILFKIPGTGPFVIAPASALPVLAHPTVINGYSQPGAYTNTLTNGDNAVIQIQLDGAGSGGADGLVLTGGGSTVEGLSITRFEHAIVISGAGGDTVTGDFLGTTPAGNAQGYGNQYGVVIQSSGNTIGGAKPALRDVISGNNNQGVLIDNGSSANRVEGSYIGTDITGASRLGNNGGGVVLYDAPSNTIGGSAAGAGNVISANGNDGVLVSSASGGLGSRSTVIQGNIIGLDAQGIVPLGNGNNGVEVAYGSGTLVGGPAAADRNIISANQAGVFLQNSAVDVAIEGNFVGTDARGLKAIGNQFDGVLLSGDNNTVGGTVAGAGNVISGNGRDGISDGVYSGTVGNNLIADNLIGTNSAGTAALGNTQDGLELAATGDVVGGTTAAARNIISANGQFGLVLGRNATGILVEGNDIGTDKTGTQPLGNGSDGVHIQDSASANIVGGTVAKDANVIAFNGGTGVSVNNNAFADEILTNSIFGNAAQGIVLTGNGNDLQPAPVLTSAVNSRAGTVVNGTLTAAPNTTYMVQFFANPAADPSGFGQGQKFLLTVSVTTNSSGVASFAVTILPAVASGHVISATATSPAGDTSAFSNAVAISTATTAAAVAPTAAIVPTPTADDLVLGALASWDAPDDGTLTGLAVEQIQSKPHRAVTAP